MSLKPVGALLLGLEAMRGPGHRPAFAAGNHSRRHSQCGRPVCRGERGQPCPDRGDTAWGPEPWGNSGSSPSGPRCRTNPKLLLVHPLLTRFLCFGPVGTCLSCESAHPRGLWGALRTSSRHTSLQLLLTWTKAEAANTRPAGGLQDTKGF